MDTRNKPEMKPLKTGTAFKVLQITGKAGMVMPLHRTTQEAVVIVQVGSSKIISSLISTWKKNTSFRSWVMKMNR